MSVYLDDGDVVLHHGDVCDVLAELAPNSVDCVVTSPPYFGLRDYGVDGQIGLEPTLAEYVARLVEVFREVRRVLAPHGVCWLNLGDSYAVNEYRSRNGIGSTLREPGVHGHGGGRTAPDRSIGVRKVGHGLKPKDLMGVPWRVALALQEDGWWLRSDVVWSKPNPMPESVTDRPTRSHEYLFLLTKAPRYYWDAEAVREKDAGLPSGNGFAGRMGGARSTAVDGGLGSTERFEPGAGRNVRSVWEIATHPFPEAHFATFPPALVERCLKAACPERVCRTCGEPRRRVVESSRTLDGAPLPEDHPRTHSRPDEPFRIPPNGVGHWRYATERATTGWTDCGHDDWRPGRVLDPFMGSGTTALVARRLGLHAVGIDLSAEYLAIAARRLQQLSLLGGVA